MAKRVLIYTNHFFPEQFKINEIVDWLLEENHHVRVVTGLPNYPKGKIFKDYDNLTKNRYKKEDRLIINRLLLIPRGNGSYFMLAINYLSYFISSILFTFFLALTKKKYDIVFVHHTSPPLIAIHPIIYSIFHKTKIFMWDLDIWPDTLKAIGILKSRVIYNFAVVVMKKIYSYYDSILIGSKSFQEIIGKRYNGEITFFPNWAEKPIENNFVRKDLHLEIPVNKFIIMYTGNIGESQNFDKLTHTIKFIDKKIHWVFIGDGRYKDNFIKSLRENKVIDKVTFFDQVSVDEIPTYVSKADCLFLSLQNKDIFSKTVPAKLQSYMALKKPILAVIDGEGADLIKISQCGFVETDSNYQNLVSLVKKVSEMSNKDLIKLSENGRNFYDLNFRSSNRKKQLLNLISQS